MCILEMHPYDKVSVCLRLLVKWFRYAPLQRCPEASFDPKHISFIVAIFKCKLAIEE